MLIDVDLGPLHFCSIAMYLFGLFQRGGAILQLLGELLHAGDGQVIEASNELADAGRPCPQPCGGVGPRRCGLPSKRHHLLHAICAALPMAPGPWGEWPRRHFSAAGAGLQVTTPCSPYALERRGRERRRGRQHTPRRQFG